MKQTIHSIDTVSNKIITSRNITIDGQKIRSININQTSGNFVVTNPMDNNIIICPQSILTGSTTTIDNLYQYGTFDTPLDAKFDSARNKIWVADAGNNRVVRLDGNSFLVDFSVQDIFYPISVCPYENTGACFVRAYTDEKTGIIAKITEYGEIEYKISFSCEQDSNLLNVESKSGYITSILPSSLYADPIRETIWWISDKICYKLIAEQKEIHDNDLSLYADSLSCINIVSKNGVALIGAAKTTAKILVVDPMNRNVIKEINIPDSNT